MVKDSSTIENMDLATLVNSIAQDTGKLVTGQVELLRSEVAQELRRAGGAAVSIAAGGGLTAAGGLLSGMMLAHLVQRTTRMPLWLCFGIVGGGVAAAGVALLQAGRQELANVQLTPPPESAATLKENAAWLKKQLTPDKR